jgi:type II restriction enzyme
LKLWSWFVDWEKVFAGTKKLEKDLKLWESLLGSADFEGDCLRLLESNPQIVRAIPELIVREGKSPTKFSIAPNLADLTQDDIVFDFSEPASTDVQRRAVVQFMVETGLSRLFAPSGVKSLRDYMIGVEAGLNSNGRKNRSGSSMEDVVEAYLLGFCENRADVRYIRQATTKSILTEFGVDLHELGKDRRFDFAVHKPGKLVLMEVNLYNSSGSKLDSIARSYPDLAVQVAEAGHTFVWITDGPGWGKSMSSLEGAFRSMDHLWSLDMLYAGVLSDLLD